jgi:hypothetical protein
MKKSFAPSALCALLLILITALVPAQDFGFGFDDEGGEGSSPPLSVNLSGELSAEFLGYVQDFKNADDAKKSDFGDVVSGKLNFGASGANVDAFIGLNLSAASISELWGGSAASPIYTPLILDEAYLRAYFGPVNIEAGLRKLSWGKADSLGPLDVINPLDYSDLTEITDIMAIKIARPMVHVSWNPASLSKLEAVFIPNFAGHRFASKGRWTPEQLSAYPALAAGGILDRAVELYGSVAMSSFNSYGLSLANFTGKLSKASFAAPDTGGLEYFQAGLRYTTSIGPADIGAQYFYGNYFRPGVSLAGVDDLIADMILQVGAGSPTIEPNIDLLSPKIEYSRYHQLGIDYAQVIYGFNLRSEFAAHITEDLAGDKGAVKNPFLAWSLGFDRDLFRGINANIQCNESIRLFNNRVADNPALDSEAGLDMTATRLTMQLSKKFLKDNLECKVTNIWDVEDSGCYIIPGIFWTIKDVKAELSAGIFAGEEKGEMGQYWRNSFIKAALSYSF